MKNSTFNLRNGISIFLIASSILINFGCKKNDSSLTPAVKTTPAPVVTNISKTLFVNYTSDTLKISGKNFKKYYTDVEIRSDSVYLKSGNALTGSYKYSATIMSMSDTLITVAMESAFGLSKAKIAVIVDTMEVLYSTPIYFTDKITPLSDTIHVGTQFSIRTYGSSAYNKYYIGSVLLTSIGTWSNGDGSVDSFFNIPSTIPTGYNTIKVVGPTTLPGNFTFVDTRKKNFQVYKN
jgi:hypothetical protein